MSAKVTLQGRLAADPELRYTPSGDAVCSLRVITSRRKKVGDNWEDADVTGWSVSAWREMAERCADALHKGDAVVVHGDAFLRQWESGEKSGVSLEVRADSIGPDLRWMDARVNKAARSGQSSREYSPSRQAPVDDPWAASSDAPF